MDEIQNWTDQNMPFIIGDLKRICKIRSVAELENPSALPYGKGCVDVLNEMLEIGRENGFETYNYDNYVGKISYPGRTKENIGIWSHLDVVNEGKNWTYPPYEPTVKDGYFIARGCQDNKSSAIIGLYTLKYLKEHNIVPKRTVEVYLGTCEEQGMYDIDYFLEHYTAPTLSLVPDSGFPVCLGERGSFDGELKSLSKVDKNIISVNCEAEHGSIPHLAEITFKYSDKIYQKCLSSYPDITVLLSQDKTEIKITARGISALNATPQKGKNALGILADFLLRAKIFEDTGAPKLSEVSGSSRESSVAKNTFSFIRDINSDYTGKALLIACTDSYSGPVTIAVTGLCIREGRFVISFVSKYPITKNDFPFRENTEKEAEKRGFTFNETRFLKANYFDPERPETKILTDVSNRVLKRNDVPFVMSGGTYARKLPNAFAFGTGMPLPKAPAGLFLPGHGNYHEPDESISLTRISKGLEIYIKGILAL